MIIADTHAHYDDPSFDADRDQLFAGAKSRGIGLIVNVGATLEGARASLAYARKYPVVRAACGIHPDECGVMDQQVMDELEEMCRAKECVAVGEIGLDYHWMTQSREIQQKWFIRQMELAVKTDLPINVHSRDSAKDTFDLIKAHHAGTTGGVIHCFSGSAQLASDYVKMGYMIGVGGVVTFKNARVLKEVVDQVPLENIVTETDCPYLAPHPFRGKRNESSYISYVIRQIAEIKGTDEEETAAILFDNACRVYRIENEYKSDPQGK